MADLTKLQGKQVEKVLREQSALFSRRPNDIGEIPVFQM